MGKTILLQNTSNNPTTVERTRSVTSFLSEAKNKRLLTQIEIEHLFWLIRNGDKKASEKAMNKLVEHNQLFVFALAKKYSSDPDTIMDLVQEGNTGLLVAIQSYDPSKGYKFLTYAVHYIRREMTQYLTFNNSLVQKTNQIKTNGAIPKIVREFTANEERQPTDDEIRIILESEYGTKINDLSDLYNLEVTSIDEDITKDNGEAVAAMVNEFNTATASLNDYEETMDKDAKRSQVNAFLSTLEDRDAQILRLYFGVGQEYNMAPEQIADVVGLTTERVRQVITESIKKLHRLAVVRNITM